MKKYYIDASQLENMNAGSKAVNDAIEIFKNNGYDCLIPNLNIKNIYLRALLLSFISIFKIILLPKGTEIILNFPPIFYFERVCLSLLKRNSKRLKVILLVHDIYELRLGEGNATPYRNLKNYKNTDFYFIAHNAKMKQWLVESGYEESKIIDLELFDYLAELGQDSGGVFGKNIIIAGNLLPEKSRYLEELSTLSEINFNLYGPNISPEIKLDQNVKYWGSFPADDIPNIIQGSYGLVWDSESMQGGSGNYGHYQRYNNPHKASLYLAAGFPVIIWKEAALAQFILKNNIGLVVDNLKELPSLLENISRKDYDQMQHNVQKIGKKIRSGYFLVQAVKKSE